MSGLRARCASAVLALALTMPSPAAPSLDEDDRPVGIYLLGLTDNALDPNVALHDAIMSHDFVDGYTLRLTWETINDANGQYDFDLIGDTLTALENNWGDEKLLNIEIKNKVTPSWANGNKWCPDSAGGPTASLRPWEAGAFNKFEDLVEALADYEHDGTALSAKTNVPLIEVGVPGLGHIRWRDANESHDGTDCADDGGPGRDLSDITGWNSQHGRTNLNSRMKDALDVVLLELPNSQAYIGVFNNLSDGASPELWEFLVDELDADYWLEASNTSTVGLFKENMHCFGPHTDSLEEHKDETYNHLQALGSWLDKDPGQPDKFEPCLNDPGTIGSGSAGADANSGPEIGMIAAYHRLNTRSFEMYGKDLDNAKFDEAFGEFHSYLHGPDTSDQAQTVETDFEGTIRESATVPGTGGQKDTSFLRVGDFDNTFAEMDYRAFISFDTSAMTCTSGTPNVVAAKLEVTIESITGSPDDHGKLMVDVGTPFFGGADALVSSDYSAEADCQESSCSDDLDNDGDSITDESGWDVIGGTSGLEEDARDPTNRSTIDYSADQVLTGWLSTNGRNAIVDDDIVHLRLRMDSTDNQASDYLELHDGDSTNPPRLEVSYECPSISGPPS